MAPPSWSQSLDNMFTSTWAYRKEEAIEQMYLKTPFIYWLKESGRVQEIRGHRRIEINLEYGKNETAQWISKGTTVPLTEGELLTVCWDDWKYLAVTVLRFGTEDQQNRGAAQIIPYVERKIKAAERSIWDDLERVAFADGTGALEPNGLQNLIHDTGGGTVHGLSRTTYPWFANGYKASTGAASVYLISDMRNTMNTMTRYSMNEIKDVFIMTGQTEFELYEDEQLEMKRLVNTKAADAGFENLTFKGRPIFWAPSAPSGNMYFINPSYLYLVIDPDYFMEMTDWKAPPNQVNDKVAQIVSAVQLCCSRPISQSVLTGISA